MQSAEKTSLNPFNASEWRVGIVVAEFNHDITHQLEASAVERAHQYNITDDQIDVIRVAGAIEIPLVLQHMAKSNKYDALLAIGCVIKGETPHFDYVCKYVTEGILRVQLDEHIPIGFGVLTCNNHKEAAERANLGSDHLDAALHQARSLNN